jgi:hypothetical protein
MIFPLKYVMSEQSCLSAWILALEFLKNYFCASLAHRKQDPPSHFLYLKKLKFDGGY